MRIAPFYEAAPPRPASPPTLRTYHDNTACPEGQRVRASGQWLPYAPTRIADTRARCPICRALD